MTALSNLGVFYRTKGDVGRAETHYRQAVEVARRVYPEHHPIIAQTLRSLGQAIVLAGDGPGGEPFLREALDVFTVGLGPDDYRALQAQSLLGLSLTMQRRYDEAERLLLDVHGTLSTLHPERTPDIATAARRLVALYEAWGRPEEAERFRS